MGRGDLGYLHDDVIVSIDKEYPNVSIIEQPSQLTSDWPIQMRGLDPAVIGIKVNQLKW